MGSAAGVQVAWPCYWANTNQLEARAGLNYRAQAGMFFASSETREGHAPAGPQLLRDKRFAEQYVDMGCLMASGKLQRQKGSMNDQGLVGKGQSPYLQRR
jgi:hypothetical protein